MTDPNQTTPSPLISAHTIDTFSSSWQESSPSEGFSAEVPSESFPVDPFSSPIGGEAMPNDTQAGPVPVPAPEPVSSKPADSTRSGYRRGSFLILFLMFLGGVLLIPWLAEEITYALNRGKERAKAEVARSLLADLPTIEQRIPWVAKAVAPSVVGIRTISSSRQGELGMDVGSGVIVDADRSTGFVLTNNHVIDHAQYVMVRLNDGRVIDAHVVGKDVALDLAVLQVDETKLSSIEWGDSSQIEVGDKVIAIGNPFDLGQTVTSGIISATERINPLPSHSRVQEFLQTDAAINPGNSGGPLVDMNGKLIGINTAIFSQTGGSMGIGFAIPSLLARKVYDEIRLHGEVKHGWLGIYMEQVTPYGAEQAKLAQPEGVVVADFFPQSPARDAGLKKGDIIHRWGDTVIRDPLHMSHLIILSKPGTTETAEVIRKGERISIPITLGSRPIRLGESND